MNQNAVIPSPQKIKEILTSINGINWDIFDWNQADYWQNKIKTVTHKGYVPYYVIFPQSKAILSQLVHLASENYWQILPVGNGTKISWGNLISRGDLLVSTAKLNSIIDHAVDDLTVTVESGVKLRDLQNFLAETGQFLPIDPCYDDSATIGGIVATANTGSWRQRYGGVRDLILGLSVIRADGKEAKAGGRVVKNVAGYDLMKLFTGSYGSLGIITEVTFRLYPLPSTSATLLIRGNLAKVKILQQQILASGLTPTMADLISSALLSSLNLGSELGLILRFQSIAESVYQQLYQVKDWAKELSLISDVYLHEDEANLWQQLKAKISLIESDSTIICKVGILPNQITDLIDKYSNCRSLINLSTGIGQILFNQEAKSTELKQIREFCQNHNGYLTVLTASASMKKQFESWGYQNNVVAMMEKLKENFDPRQVFVNRLF